MRHNVVDGRIRVFRTTCRRPRSMNLSALPFGCCQTLSKSTSECSARVTRKASRHSCGRVARNYPPRVTRQGVGLRQQAVFGGRESCLTNPRPNPCCRRPSRPNIVFYQNLECRASCLAMMDFRGASRSGVKPGLRAISINGEDMALDVRNQTILQARPVIRAFFRSAKRPWISPVGLDDESSTRNSGARSRAGIGMSISASFVDTATLIF